jgi:phospholipid/cholesterol/gamma-HCH transport system substrate-binding protein
LTTNNLRVCDKKIVSTIRQTYHAGYNLRPVPCALRTFFPTGPSMATARTKFSVGLFVVAGLALGVVTIITLGMTKILNRGATYVTFFDESVQGLNIDSPVKYRGVPIGRVSAIQVAPDSRLIEVVMDIDKDVIIKPDSEARLSAVGITGSMFVNLDIRSTDDPGQSPIITFETDYPVIPSTPSDITQIMNSISVLYHRLLEIDLKGIADRIKESLDHFNTAIDDLALAELSRDARATIQGIDALIHDPGWKSALASTTEAGETFNMVMEQTRVTLGHATALLARVDRLVAVNEPTLNATIQELHDAVSQTTTFVTQGTTMVAGSRDYLETMQKHLLVTLQNLEKASRGLNRLLDELEDQPSRLIMGDPPEPRVIDK